MLTEAAINSLNRVLQHFDRNAFAIISASRHIYSEKENEARTAELKDLVRKRKEPKTAKTDNQRLKWLISSVILACKKLLKELEI